MRTETRKERYNKKITNSKTYPISLCAINFRIDDNLGYLIRTAACFGASCINVIGSIPERKRIFNSSGSLIDYVKINQFKTPRDFLNKMKETKTKIICAELVQEAKSIYNYNFNFDNNICLVVGNETSGIPADILNVAEKVYIPMPGFGFCLNTSQAANIILFEATKQFEMRLN